jgi:coenzyme F420-reducing hydrogenase beta subunit/Na+-translocating ferredoxin:NAD+ oxidoreductase RnfD subunit
LPTILKVNSSYFYNRTPFLNFKPSIEKILLTEPIVLHSKKKSIKEIVKSQMSKPNEYSWMTKDKLMTYTAIALAVLVGISILSFGYISILVALIAVGVAVLFDTVIGKVAADSQINTMSAVVFGLIVACSYTLGLPTMGLEGTAYPLNITMQGPGIYLFPAIISMVGIVLFKKIPKNRKYVNPAAAAKLLVLVFIIVVALFPVEHTEMFPNLQSPLSINSGSPIPFGLAIQQCFGRNFSAYTPDFSGLVSTSLGDVLSTLFLLKYHGWIGGVSSIAVIAVGLALFAVCRRYIKWRITASYLVSVALVAFALSFVYADGDPIIRAAFHLFIGSSIFLAFFMATDPATTPLTYSGQLLFGVGLGVLSVLIVTYMNGFFGGSILALVIMNLTSPFLDRVGVRRPKALKKEPKLPAAKQYASVKTYPCMRCGACMNVCCNQLSPILIKQAFDKKDAKQLMKLDADYCAGCGNCNFVCPARINLRSTMLTYPLQDEEEETITSYYLNGTADENIGVYSEIFSAKSEIEGQDGGVATALLVSGMQKGLFDTAIVVKRTDGYWAEAVVAKTPDEIIQAKGTKYIRVHMMSKLAELIAQGKRKIAIVGTACQVRAARRVQQVLLSEYPDLELTIMGLFCFEEFNYEKLKEETKRLLNVDLDKAEKTQIRKGKYIVCVDGKEHSVAVKELNSAVENGCLCCPDFAANYSDISVGSVGSADGYSTVIVRSDVGTKLLATLDLTKCAVKQEEVTKLAVQKKKRAEEGGSD